LKFEFVILTIAILTSPFPNLLDGAGLAYPLISVKRIRFNFGKGIAAKCRQKINNSAQVAAVFLQPRKLKKSRGKSARGGKAHCVSDERAIEWRKQNGKDAPKPCEDSR
jgi:hypothetical protein